MLTTHLLLVGVLCYYGIARNVVFAFDKLQLLRVSGGIREYSMVTSSRGQFRTFGGTVEDNTDDAHNALMGYDLVYFNRNNNDPVQPR